MLNNTPAKIVDIPIHSNVMVPDAKLSSIDLFVIIEVIPFCDSIKFGGMCDIPFSIDAKIINVPAKYENILMNLKALVWIT